MPFFRLLGTLAVLVIVGACSKPAPPGNVPQLPDLELLETTEGAPYEVSLAATGGTPPLYHSLEKVPPGLSFYTGPGLLKGPATASGQYSFSVQVKDATGATDTRTYRLLVHPAPVVGTTALPAATTGTQYAFRLMANGGKAPLRWTLATGTLPPGISLAEDGQLAGLPLEPGTHALTVRVQDVHGAQATKSLSLEARAGTTGSDGGTSDAGTGDGGTPDAGTADAGSTLSFSLANWNIEWFGDPYNGPTDDVLQLDNVQAVIADAGMDFWGLAELVDTTEFNALKQQLPGYDGFMANDSSRVSSAYSSTGAPYYSTTEQKVGVLFRSDVVSVRSAQLILTARDYEFAGRPPLRVDLRVTRNGTSVDLVAIVMHMKALADRDSYDRRASAALLLKDYLDTYLPNERVIVLGDWNDDVDVSIAKDSTSGSYLPTPFQNFLDDTTNYTFVTRPLSLANQRSTVNNSQFIDHQLVSNELMASYVSNSTQLLKPGIYNYGNTTSDHYPVLSQFAFSAAPPPPPPVGSLRLLWPNGGEQLTGSTTQYIFWTADGVDNVRLEYSKDDGETWQEVFSSHPAPLSFYSWTLPPTPTTRARFRVTDTSAPSVTDDSDSTFEVVKPPVFINEYLPYEPALPDGGRDFAQQFVEVVNDGAETLDLSGWMVNDLSAYNGTVPARHVFPYGTQLAPGSALVVFSGASAIPADSTNAMPASSGGLFFNRTNERVYLQDNLKQPVDETDYPSATEAVSYNRDPDGARDGGFVLHTIHNPALGSSPGRRADGGTF
jgi:endonuclease/exonuclease/phosphatase family metal-dependent hydrolase